MRAREREEDEVLCAMLAEKKAQAKTAPRETEGEEERETSQDTEEES